MDTYDFESKHLYRARRELAIDQMSAKTKYLRRVAYLDTGEALDTISYLKRGYQAENLWAINNNPAEVASLTRKLKTLGFPAVHTVGVDFVDALEKRVPDVDVIDFDGMSNLNKKTVELLSKVILSRNANEVIGITILSGRESLKDCWYRSVVGGKSFDGSPRFDEGSECHTSFGTKTNSSHKQRIRTLVGNIVYKHCSHADCELGLACRNARCFAHVKDLKWDTYQSISGQPMVWTVFKLVPHIDHSLRKFLDDAHSRVHQIKILPLCVLRSLSLGADNKSAESIVTLHA